MFGVGIRMGPYELLSELGRGGMATLYLGRQTGLGGFARRVAIKVIHPDIANDPEVIRMFLDEARLGACMRHPNVVHVENIGEHEGRPFLVMDYVDGCSLAHVMRGCATKREPLPIEVAVAIVARIAEGLHAAHESSDEAGRPLGLVHRDVSPSNVLIDTRGHVMLIDFGVAKARERLARTMPGLVKGKLAYMAPEQLSTPHHDRRVDVFALGVVLWEMLTLRRLFYATTDVETIFKIRESGPIDPPSQHRPEMSQRIDDVVLTMLARDVEERFCTAAAARHALLSVCPAALRVEASAIASLVSTASSDAPAGAPADAGTVAARPSVKPRA